MHALEVAAFRSDLELMLAAMSAGDGINRDAASAYENIAMTCSPLLLEDDVAAAVRKLTIRAASA